MTTLTAFISDRIEEDEAVATRAFEECGSQAWVADKVYDGVYSLDLESKSPNTDSYGVGGDVPLPREVAQYIARFDPARVLTECAVKRYILQSYVADGEDPHPGFPCTDDIEFDPDGEVYEALHPSDRGACERHLASWDHQHHSEFVLKVLALAWADHPDYNQEWAV